VQSLERVPARGFYAAALLLPIALACVHHGLGHTGDVAFFREWYLAVRASAAFYRDGPGLNYPIVGVLLVSAPACVVDALLGHRLDLETYRLVLKATLVVGEVLFLVLAEQLARALGEPRPRTLALCLYLLPSSWAGAAWFGQIDVWGTVLLFGAATHAIRFRRDGTIRSLAFALGFAVLAILTKQLTWFAIPAILAIVAIGLARHGARAHWTVVLLAPLGLFIADPFLVLPSGYASHLFFIATHGSSHGDLVVASGASLWSLVAVGGTPSSELVWLGLDSRTWGWLAFALAQIVIVRVVSRRPDDRALVLAAGLGELAMATLLTGVHERYLAHAIPLLVIARGTTPRGPSIALGALVGLLSGAFVLATLYPDALSFFAHPAPVALLSLAWGIALLLELARG
jgi:hypothetical protein